VIAARLGGSTIGAPDPSFVLAEWADEGETSRERPVAPLHAHLEEDEAWYVLEGALGFRVGEEELVARAGDAVVAPRGAPHTYWNAGPGRARYLLVMGPRTAALVEAIHATQARDPETMHALFRAHASELHA
jgi:mannose-6-phosphate isomerase-like protein (cupin superfamily)